jgi:hypothetical protein
MMKIYIIYFILLLLAKKNKSKISVMGYLVIFVKSHPFPNLQNGMFKQLEIHLMGII